MRTGGDGRCASVERHCRKRSFQVSFVGPVGSVCLWGNITAAASQCLRVLGRAAILFPRLVANPVREHLDLLWISLGREMHRDGRGQTDLRTRRALAGTFTQCGGRGLGVTPTTHPKWLTGKLKWRRYFLIFQSGSHKVTSAGGRKTSVSTTPSLPLVKVSKGQR